jgi:hypothetical protein
VSLVPVGVKLMAPASHARTPESGIRGHVPLKVDLLIASVRMEFASVLVPHAIAYNANRTRRSHPGLRVGDATQLEEDDPGNRAEQRLAIRRQLHKATRTSPFTPAGSRVVLVNDLLDPRAAATVRTEPAGAPWRQDMARLRYSTCFFRHLTRSPGRQARKHGGKIGNRFGNKTPRNWLESVRQGATGEVLNPG